MIIESASTRLGIDLLYSLKKNGYIASDIRVSYISTENKVDFKTFKNLDELVNFYSKYKFMIASRRSPFTTDRALASFGKISDYGKIFNPEPTPSNVPLTPGACQLGAYVGIEHFKLINDVLGFDLIFNCLDVSENFKIQKGKSFDLRKNKDRVVDMTKYEKRISKFILDYQFISHKLFETWNADLYVDLCYVKAAYVQHTYNLFKLFFPIVKRKISSGLERTVLDSRYLKRFSETQ